MTDELIPLEVILAAQKHDPDAINTILEHYSNRIQFHFFNMLHQPGKEPSRTLLAEFRQFVEARLILAVDEFDATAMLERNANEEDVHN